MTFANEFEELLDIYENKSDLSEKTRLENSGTVIYYTRQDLEIMQARTLKDILKSYPAFHYKESRFGYADPFNTGSNLPFASSLVRVYIDNFEVTSAMYGSSLPLLAEMNIDFVDHVELYALNPSLEYTSEPTMLLIRLFTKSSERDLGGRVTLGQGERNYNHQSIYHVGQVDDWHYLAYVGHIGDRKKPVEITGVKVDRDKESIAAVFNLKNNRHTLSLNAFVLETSPLFNVSLDATPGPSSHSDMNHYTLGYHYLAEQGMEVKFMHEMGMTSDYFTDDNPYAVADLDDDGIPEVIDSFAMDSRYTITTLEGKYLWQDDRNQFIMGVKSRIRSFEYDKLEISGVPQTPSGFNKQTFFAGYVQNQYSLNPENVLVAGILTGRINNNANVTDNTIRLGRLGHTYASEDWTVATFLYHMDSPVEPYVYNSFFSGDDILEAEQTSLVS